MDDVCNTSYSTYFNSFILSELTVQFSSLQTILSVYMCYHGRVLHSGGDTVIAVYRQFVCPSVTCWYGITMKPSLRLRMVIGPLQTYN